MFNTQNLLCCLYLAAISLCIFIFSFSIFHAKLACDSPLYATGFDK